MAGERRRASYLALLELVGACVAAAFFVVTLLDREWIEHWFGVEPDAGSGSVEWLIVIAAAVCALGLAMLARRSWLRARQLG